MPQRRVTGLRSLHRVRGGSYTTLRNIRAQLAGSCSVGRMDLSPRLRAVCDLDVAIVREYSGRHEYDGKPQDLSPGGVRSGLARLAAARDGGERLADPHDEAHLAAAEDLRLLTFAEL